MKKISKLTDLEFDERNLNKHTVRGFSVVEESLRSLGAGRSVLADKNGKLIAGNLTTEVAIALGAEDDVIVVRTDGSKLVVVQRTDLDIDTDSKAKQLAVADNRASQVSLDWDAPQLAELYESGEAGDMSWMFRSDEITSICGVQEDQKELEELSITSPKERESEKSTYMLTLCFETQEELANAAVYLTAAGFQVMQEAQ